MDETNSETAKAENHNRMVSIASILISFAALGVAVSQAASGKKIPFQNALYEARVTSMQNYARAHTIYERKIALVMSDLPYDVFSPAALSNVDDRGMQETALVAHQILDEYALYSAEVKATNGLWPDKVQQQVDDAKKLASSLSQCMFKLGEHTLTTGRYSAKQMTQKWRETRLNAAAPCAGLNDHQLQQAFVDAGDKAIADMQNQLRAIQNDMVPEDQ